MTPTAVISVRGTTFDVSVDDDDQTTFVSVEEGAVDVRHALKPGETKTVNAGESMQVYRDEPLAQKPDRQERAVAAHNPHMAAAARVAIIHSRTPGLGTITQIPGGSGQTVPTPPPSVPPPPLPLLHRRRPLTSHASTSAGRFGAHDMCGKLIREGHHEVRCLYSSNTRCRPWRKPRRRRPGFPPNGTSASCWIAWTLRRSI